MKKSIKYYPYGDCRNSQGTLGTDKLFTGQRLDDTGLYYYGARYYDPMIGRFISADTIVQNAANPQTLNRYSYCLNNPLKYTDPSGLRVYIGRTDVSVLKDILDQINEAEEFGCEPSAALMAAFWDAYNGLGENWVDLFDAWEKFGSVSGVANYLEETEEIYTIMYTDTVKTGRYSDATNTIKVNPRYIGDVETTASIIAHETVHTYAEGTSSIYEEAVAYRFMHEVEDLLGIKDMGWQKDVVGGINVLVPPSRFSDSLTTDLYEARETWHAMKPRLYEDVKYLYPTRDAYQRLWKQIILPYLAR